MSHSLNICPVIKLSATRVLLSFLSLALAMTFGGCDSQPPKVKTSAETQLVTDDLGRQMTLPRQLRRILPLAPSMTEMLFAVADTATIIARTQNCDYPAAALSKPIVQNYPMDYEGLLALKPDVVFAPDGIISADVAHQIEKLGIPVYFQKYDSVADIIRGLRDLGRLLNRQSQANALVDSLQSQLNQLLASQTDQQKPGVLGIIWPDPIYVYGSKSLFTDKIRYAGGRNVVPQELAQESPALTRESILQLNPDVLYGGTRKEMDQKFFSLYPELKRIKAYQRQQIYPVTDNLMSRPSPRVVESILELKKAFR